MSMNDKDLASWVEGRVRQASGAWTSSLSTERTLVQRYFDGLEPKPLHAANSKYVSQDLYEGVEAMKAQLLEVFASNGKPVTFAPQGAEDVANARDGTEYVTYNVFRQNPGFAILHDWIEDGLKGRVGVVQAWYDENTDEDEEEVSDVPYAEFAQMLAAKPDAQLVDLDLDSATETVKSATIVTKRDTSQVRIECVPPEEFGISQGAKSAKDAEVVFRRGYRTADELTRMGVSAKIVRRLRSDNDVWLSKDSEKVNRHFETSDMGPQDRTDEDDDDTSRLIETIDAYAVRDLDGRPKLWRILVAGGEVLLKKPAKRAPFVYFTPLPRPHSFWGANYAKKIIPIQNAKTLLQRSIIDHALITNNPKIQVVQGGLPNPRELMENRIGGIVNVKNATSLLPMPQTGLNPFVFQTIEQMDTSKESVTGVSRLSQGLNKDAVSKQNSNDMITGLVTLSQVRQKIVARHFGEALKALYLEIYRLVVENEKAERIIEVAGAWTPVDPSKWPDRKDVIAEVTVGFGEKENERAKWVGIDNYLSKDPQLARVYTPDRRFHVVSKALEAMGIKDTQSVIADPATIPPAEPDPMHEAEIKVKLAQAAQAEAQAQASVQKLSLEAERIRLEHEISVAELQVRMMETQGKLRVQQAEVEMAREAQAAGKLSAVASPDA